MPRNLFAGLVPGLIVLLGIAGASPAAPPDRVTRAVNPAQLRTVPASLPPLAQPRFDRGAVDDATPMRFMVLLFKPSTVQLNDLDRLLADQQNPSSPLFHQWLTPEEFGNRFGLSSGDRSKVVAWLHQAGFTVEQSARGHNWVAFRGSAGQVSRGLHTPIHRFEVRGESHFANTAEPSVPEALADVVGGFLGLDDFNPKPGIIPAGPEYNAGSSHYLAPEDFATIYNLAPLYQAGIDGTGQSIAVVGQSDVSVSDIRAFRSRYNLPANDPKMMPYSSDPGFTGAQEEGNLDLEWAGAIAPKATIYYVYGANPITAVVSAVNLNVAPIVSISYGGCEIEDRLTYWRSIAQQANAQGITILSASGDSGAAGCDALGSDAFATLGRAVTFPAVLPEVTAVGGTQFVEGSGTYWASTSSSTFGSALSYIPEAAWNESGTGGLLASGGGASQFYAKPAWQTGPGVPNDHARDIPDVSLSAALHDGYYITYIGANRAVAGTSASTPSMAGIVALINQYQVSKGFQKQPGLGNINPQLYRLAQTAPSAFHDITSGGNTVPCAQGSPDCATGSFGYQAAPGYDLATGLGSVDANNLVSQWNTAVNGVTVTLSVSASRATLNDTIQATAVVTPTGSGTPTGTVTFTANGVSFGSVALSSGAQPSAVVAVPLYQLGGAGTFTFTLTAQYSGDAAFSGGGATTRIAVTMPTGAAAIIANVARYGLAPAAARPPRAGLADPHQPA